ncbi:MAG TPA: hypothetical protein PKD59_12260 [Miltoncostaeaceae bacterium]|nr:hypothetical protein [Miltoncostaeaceae bacterium]
MTARRLAPAAVALVALLAAAAPALGARILPPGDRYGDAAVDLSTNGRAAVAYERALPGPDRIRVAIRRVDRLNRPTAGYELGRGNLQLVRVGDAAAGPHVVAWKRRGELLVSVLSRGTWRTERLPQEVRSFTALSAAVAGSRVVLVAGDDTDAVALVRTGPRRWVSRPLPPGPARTAVVARASEPSGRVVAAWSEAGVAGQSVAASSFDPGSLQWAPPTTLVAPGTYPSPAPADLYLNARGDAVLSVSTAEDHFGAPPAIAPVRYLPALSPAWVALPNVPVITTRTSVVQVAVTPDGTPVYARSGDGARLGILSGGVWGPEEVAWTGPADPDFGTIDAVDDLAVAQGGRVVMSVAVDPGPGPDSHSFLVRSAVGGAWGAPSPFASTYGTPELVVGGRRIAATWVEDPSSTGLPEAVLAP